MSANVCRYSWDCKRADCYFSHPQGRAIDAPPAGNAQMGMGPPQQMGMNPGMGGGMNPGMGGGMQPMAGRMPPMMQPMMGPQPGMPTAMGAVHQLPNGMGMMMQVPPPAPMAARGPGGGGGGRGGGGGGDSGRGSGGNPCRFGYDCRRVDCYYNHPGGRAIDANGGGGGSGGGGGDSGVQGLQHTFSNLSVGSNNSATDELQILKETWFAASRTCTCCKGYVYACENSICANLGQCTCSINENDMDNDSGTAGIEENEGGSGEVGGSASPRGDDSESGGGPSAKEQQILRETWFAAARDCTCCKGYIYACENEICANLSKCTCSIDQKDMDGEEGEAEVVVEEEGGEPAPEETAA